MRAWQLLRGPLERLEAETAWWTADAIVEEADIPLLGQGDSAKFLLGYLQYAERAHRELSVDYRVKQVSGSGSRYAGLGTEVVLNIVGRRRHPGLDREGKGPADPRSATPLCW